MRTPRLIAAIALSLSVAIALPGQAAAKEPGSSTPAPPKPKVLVLYDNGGPYRQGGPEFALMSRNLLGHFDVDVQVKPAVDYIPGEMQFSNTVIYIGTTYEERSFYPLGSVQRQSYDAFLADTANGLGTVVWMGQNIWNLAWSWDPAWGADGFKAHFGFAYQSLSLATDYNGVLYKDTQLVKGVVKKGFPGANINACINHTDGSYDCDTELGQIVVSDPSIASVVARVTINGAPAGPYITHSRNLWYVGDVPLTYITESDRYLAFADLLHDMLGIDHPTEHRALVRFEDVSAQTAVANLEAVANVLSARSIPFAVATIPKYRDPLGFLNAGIPVSTNIAGSATGNKLRAFVKKGVASIVQHGTTHQFGVLPNPYNGMSGDDFEFYRVAENADLSLTTIGPVPGDSAQWATDRIKSGTDELRKAGLGAFAWEAPHYMASGTDYRAIANLYPYHYGRMVYFPNPGEPLGQFYPYPVTDSYGVKVIPENIGNVEPDPFNGYPQWFPADLIARAKAASVVRDGYASFFYHPFLGPSMLAETVDGIRALGYHFVAPCSVARAC